MNVQSRCGGRGCARDPNQYRVSLDTAESAGRTLLDADMGTMAPRRLLLITLTCLLVALGAPNASAQGSPDPTPPSSSTTSSTTTTVPGSTSTTLPTTPDPSAPGSTTVPSGPTTTVPVPPYLPPLPPELIGDPRVPFLVDPGPGDGVDVPVAQNSFDPLSVLIRPELVERAQEAVDAATASIASLREQLADQGRQVNDLNARLEVLDGGLKDTIATAAEARKDLLEHAVTAYMVGDMDHRLAVLNSGDMVDHGVARSYVQSVVDGNERLLRRYQDAKRGLSRNQAAMAEELGQARADLAALTSEVAPAFDELLSRIEELAAYEAGAQAYIDGFVFPVAGDVEFIDSWGYPRMSGTASAHWHQGTDIFATAGTPLIASENGVLDRIGSGTLGGNKLWIVGESGTEYYYAHLSGFTPGIKDGMAVRAGEVVGYVGDTGNARGTSPHLHFEMHPDGIGPANPYPLLKAAYGNRPVAPAVGPAPTVSPAPTAAPVPTTVPGG